MLLEWYDLCYIDYVCVNVLFGINGMVLNNVNVSV